MSKVVILILPLILSGCFPAIFTAATGTTLAVAKDRTIGETVRDIKIANSLRAELIKKDFREIYTKINIEVVDGRILLTGKVNTEEHVLKVIEIAWKQDGVKEVLNEIKVDEHSSHFNVVQYTKDSLITTQIKSKIFVDRSIKFVNYTIVTLDNVVYLFGISRSNDELEKVAEIASKIRGVKKVVSHVEFKNSSESDHEGASFKDY
ncbi:MAG: BON domain-containing protein [Janthinobacterium lividum]